MRLDDLIARSRESRVPYRAGGTDLMARDPAGPYIDLRDVPELSGIDWRPDGSARIGALATIAQVARDARLAAAYPALTLTAAALATPQIREAATVGGNLLQRSRCVYLRDHGVTCHQNGGDSCPAADGPMELFATVLGSSPCRAPHPSSLAVALLCQDAAVEVHGRGVLPIRALYSEDPTRDHLLEAGEILTAVHLPPPVPGERAAYHRAISRARAEWPLVEAVARLVVADGAIVSAAVAVGGVARTPLRLPDVEAALLAGRPVADAASLATRGCAPAQRTAYKVTLLAGTVQEVVERALG